MCAVVGTETLLQPCRWFDLVIVLKTENSVLFDRLLRRCGLLPGIHHRSLS